jgi:N-acetylglucosaminyl-diphospho-decaprenol L-rhamnosyltransferase
MYVDIIIVNWNSGDYLRKCLASVFTDANNIYINKVIIVDNNSTDNSLTSLVQNDKIIFINNNENLGFSKACNQGFKICTAQYTLLLNPDARLLDDTLQSCCLFMQARKDICILGCQLLDDKNSITASCARFPTAKSFFYKSIGLTNILPGVFPSPDLMLDSAHTESGYVDQIIGAFMFIRQEVFEKIGYFDERFFVYFEELDFSKRLAEAGGKSYFNVDIKAIHNGQGSTESVKAFAYFLNFKSRLAYAKKHFSQSGYALVFISTFLFEPVSRILFLLVQTKFKDAMQIAKAYKLLIKSFYTSAPILTSTRKVHK